uniref:Uncharacterized protein n=1 Tax=Oryza sativa subsp. japonica TaxID=39947 RepID=Q8GVX1_ORYSJ|nr:hypothetical protein [Oryza sativa Japonica Group]
MMQSSGGAKSIARDLGVSNPPRPSNKDDYGATLHLSSVQQWCCSDPHSTQQWRSPSSLVVTPSKRRCSRTLPNLLGERKSNRR